MLVRGMESGQAQIKGIFELCMRDKSQENAGIKIFITDGTMVGVLVFLLNEHKQARRKSWKCVHLDFAVMIG